MAWLPLELRQLLRHLLDVPDEIVRSDVRHHPEIWDEICGWYQLPQHISDLRVHVMMGGGTTAVHADLGSQPLSLFKRPATRRPGASLTIALGALAVVSAVRAFRRRSRPDKGV